MWNKEGNKGRCTSLKGIKATPAWVACCDSDHLHTIHKEAKSVGAEDSDYTLSVSGYAVCQYTAAWRLTYIPQWTEVRHSWQRQWCKQCSLCCVLPWTLVHGTVLAASAAWQASTTQMEDHGQNHLVSSGVSGREDHIPYVLLRWRSDQEECRRSSSWTEYKLSGELRVHKKVTIVSLAAAL